MFGLFAHDEPRLQTLAAQERALTRGTNCQHHPECLHPTFAAQAVYLATQTKVLLYEPRFCAVGPLALGMIHGSTLVEFDGDD